MSPFEQLASAVRAHDLAAARATLEKHPELRHQLNDAAPGEDFGGLLILTAARKKNVAMLDLLLEHGANINAKSRWWAGPFHLLEVCDLDFVPELLARGASMDACAAARVGNLEQLRRLLDEDPGRLHMRCGDGKTPLHYASTVEIAQLLLERGADINAIDVDHESTAAQYLVSERPDVARYLVTRGIKTDILLASALGATQLVRRILDEKPDAIRTRVNNEWFPMSNPRAGGTIYIWTLGASKSAYLVAREKGHIETAALLAERAPAAKMLSDLALLGDIDAARALLARDPSVISQLSASDAAVLSSATFDVNNKAVQFMLDAGWPVNVADVDGMTPLHAAAWQGQADIVDRLLAAGANTAVREKRYDGTPLDWAEHGSRNSWRRNEGDYAAVTEQLRKAIEAR